MQLAQGRWRLAITTNHIYTSTCFALAGLGLTIFAAPYLISVWSMPDDPILLQQQFNHFHFWGLFRAVAQILSFFTCVFALSKVFELEKK